MFNLKPSMLEALFKYNGALPQALAPNLFMLILTIFNHETAPPWTGRTGIPPLHILMTGKKILLLKWLLGTGCLTSTPKVIYSAIFFY